MSKLEEIRSERIKKLKRYEKENGEGYSDSRGKTVKASNIHKNFEKLIKSKKKVSLAGRVMAIRGQGALIFFDVFDGTAKIQGIAKRGELKEKLFALFTEIIDIGDFLEVNGSLFLTDRGEKSLIINNWRLLGKSLRPLPDKWHGLKDDDERFRRRYLESVMDEETRERFIIRSHLITEIRNFLNKEGFVEFESPILQPISGGANAEPFITHHKALNIDLYLRVAPELYLKRLLVGSFSKVYELGRAFRNEGIDLTHNPEFTIVEWYEAYSNSKREMKRVEKLLIYLCKRVKNIGLKAPFEIIGFNELIKKYTNLPDPLSANHEELATEASRLGVIVPAHESNEKILDAIYKKKCRSEIINPTFIVDYPAGALPLAKRKKKNKNLAEAFQLIVNKLELAKGFSELNDPLDQKSRFNDEEAKKEKGDNEAQNMDNDFIEALEYGMPPAGGVGIGIDRLTMLFLGQKNIREVIFFPTLRPRE